MHKVSEQIRILFITFSILLKVIYSKDPEDFGSKAASSVEKRTLHNDK